MTDFKTRFAEYNAATGEYAFSNVRNGLIVGLVCPTRLQSSPGKTIDLPFLSIALYRNYDWRPGGCPHR